MFRMETNQRETSTNVPEFCKTSITNFIQPVLPPSVKMNGSPFLQTAHHTREYDREAKPSPRWALEQRSDSCQSSTPDFPELTVLSPTPLMCNRPFLQREDPNGPRYDKRGFEESISTRGPGRSYINRISVMILGLLLILSCVASAFACIYLKHLIDRCNDLEAKLHSAQSTYQQLLHDAEEFCLPCNQLIQGPFEEDNVALKNLTYRTVDGVALCCGRTPTQFLIILDLYVQQKQKEKCAQEIQNSSSTKCTNVSSSIDRPIGTPISVHLEAGLQEESAIGKRYQPIRNWKDNKVTTHISGLILNNDRLIVPESGLYFVYSQVGFEVHYNSNEAIESANQTLYHYLNRYNPIYPNGGNQTIVKGAATQCWEKIKQFGYYTSYASATVRLNERDELYIMVSQLYISRDPKLTYIGAYKIY
ncbi:hypothetical protein CHS0354_002593 [Potamilus streckersoni]|uniref:THD domain-containing protein n=1 Tax=Potamilus streckersoni TaxID=2493646 RepID=A0AAE0VG58_9BIVA|nr:hypothetical protein CHS0354_002593 [Potamilus streckersoni]